MSVHTPSQGNQLNQASFVRFHDLKRGLIAGAIAIAINTILLQIGSALHIQTGHGGLLMWLAKHLGFAPIAWNQGILGMLPMKIWKTGFHLLVGMGMAIFYIFIVEPALGRKLSPLSKRFHLCARNVVDECNHYPSRTRTRLCGISRNFSVWTFLLCFRSYRFLPRAGSHLWV